ncbi:MAG: hypothetical protein ACKVHP_02575, partial [Verrucomicrobiales bacterium]
LAEAKKWIRSNRLWRWAVPGLGVIIAISVIAFAQSRRSEKSAIASLTRAQTSEAEALQARSQAEDLIDFTIREVYNELKSAGNLDMLEQVITKVDAYLVSLPESTRESTQTLFLQSLTRHRSALIQRSRGHTKEAQSRMREAVTL